MIAKVLQVYESMKCLLLLLFLHYPDLQSSQHPPGMWHLHFGQDSVSNQGLGLSASPKDQ